MRVAGSLQKQKRSPNWYMVIYTQDSVKPKWISTGTPNKNEAKNILRKKLNDMEKGIDGNSKVTMEKLFELYLNYAENIKKLEYNTLRPYRAYIKNHLNPYMGDKKIESVSPLFIDEYFLQKQKTLSSGTLKQHLSILNNVFTFAIKKHLLSYNPAEKVELPKIVQMEYSVWDIDTCRKFYQDIKGNRYYILFLLAITTGQREGELCALQINDYNKETGYLTVGHSINYRQERKCTKSGKIRSFKLPETVQKEVEKHIRIVEWQMRTQKGFNTDGYFVSNKQGKALNPKTLYTAFVSFCKKNNYPKIRVHDLRHSFATFMLEDGLVDIKTVSNMLGHARVQTTQQIYQKVTPKMKENIASSIEGKLFTNN